MTQNIPTGFDDNGEVKLISDVHKGERRFRAAISRKYTHGTNRGEFKPHLEYETLHTMNNAKWCQLAKFEEDEVISKFWPDFVEKFHQSEGQKRV